MHDDVYDVWPQREGTGETSHAKPNYVAVEMILPPTDRSIDRMMTQNPSLKRNERRRRRWLSEGRAARLLFVLPLGGNRASKSSIGKIPAIAGICGEVV